MWDVSISISYPPKEENVFLGRKEEEEAKLTIIDRTRRENGLLPLAQAGINALIDQQLGDAAVARLIDVLALRLQLGARLREALLVVLRVVDVAHRVPLLGLVDGAEMARAQQARLEEFRRRAEVPGVLLVAQVAGFHKRRFLGPLFYWCR